MSKTMAKKCEVCGGEYESTTLGTCPDDHCCGLLVPMFTLSTQQWLDLQVLSYLDSGYYTRYMVILYLATYVFHV